MSGNSDENRSVSGLLTKSAPKVEVPSVNEQMIKYRVKISENPGIKEAHKSIKLEDKPKYEAAYNTLFKPDATKEEKYEATRTMYHLLRGAEKYDDKNAMAILNFIGVSAEFLAYLLKNEKREDANRFATDVGNNKISSVANVFTQATKWGYSDWVALGRKFLAENTAFISNIAASFISPMNSGMQAVVDRLRSVDQRAKEKLEELKADEAKDKQLSTDEKREKAAEKLREDANKILREEQEEKWKPEKMTDLTYALATAKTVKGELPKELEAIETAREGLVKKIPLETAFNNPKFEAIFEDHRREEVEEAGKRKYFKSGLVPAKVEDAVANIRPPAIANYGPVSELCLFRAYRKTLQDFAQLPQKEMYS